MNRDKQIDIDIAVEEMASAVRERTVACNKCEYYKEGSCLKPVDWGCNDNEDILNLCDAIYEKGYRKASDVAREIFEEIEERLGRLADESKILRDKEINLGEKTQLNGEWIGVRLALRDTAELKKKYTESEDTE